MYPLGHPDYSEFLQVEPGRGAPRIRLRTKGKGLVQNAYMGRVLNTTLKLKRDDEFRQRELKFQKEIYKLAMRANDVRKQLAEQFPAAQEFHRTSDKRVRELQEQLRTLDASIEVQRKDQLEMHKEHEKP